MSTERWSTLIHTLRRFGGTGPSSDRDLLRRFVEDQDHGAFAELVRRHAGPVYAVCWRELRHAHDAEDAFQATFMVLARKADREDWNESLGGWLQEVAHRTSAHLRRERSRRSRPQLGIDGDPAEDSSPPIDAADLSELTSVADEEVRRLPERYRAPIIACYWDGLTQEEAARQLGWSYRTLKRRLTDGRELLRARLSGRGVTFSAGLLVAVAAREEATAQVPAALIAEAAGAAARFAARPGWATAATRAELLACACGAGRPGLSPLAVKVGGVLMFIVGAAAGMAAVGGGDRQPGPDAAASVAVPAMSAVAEPADRTEEAFPLRLDIGAPRQKGSTRFAAGRYEVLAGGKDIWETADQFHFAYAPARVEQTVVARVVEQNSADGWSKAGLMFRGGPDPGAAFVGLYVTPNAGVTIQWRDVAGGNTGWAGASEPVTAPVWLRLTRRGDRFDADYATTAGRPADTDWVSVVGGRHKTRLPADALAGLAVCSHSDTATATTTFSGVTVGRPGAERPERPLFSVNPAFAFERPPDGPPVIDHAAGFDDRGFAFNGFGTDRPVAGGALRLTDGVGRQTRTAFKTERVGVASFATRFRFRRSPHQSAGEGFTFCLQGTNPFQVGGPEYGLGADGIPKGLAVTFHSTDDAGGPPRVGLTLTAGTVIPPDVTVVSNKGRPPRGPGALDADVRYDGQDLWLTVAASADPGQWESARYRVDVPAAVGGDTAFVGFTGGAGLRASVQEILAWTYTTPADAAAPAAAGTLPPGAGK